MTCLWMTSGSDEVHRAAELERGGLGDALGGGQEHRDDDDAVAGPLDLGLDEAPLAQLRGGGEAHVDVVLGVELVDERDLAVVAQRAAADRVARLGAASALSPHLAGRWLSPKWWQTGAR